MILDVKRLSTEERINGRMKETPRDFIVEEITENGNLLELDKQYKPEEIGFKETEGKFSILVMQKENWDTSQALKEIARKSGRGFKSVGFAGTKDRISVSTQLCSIFGADPERLLGVHIKDLKINGAWKSDKQIRLGDLLGNKFTITIRTENQHGAESIDKINNELNGIFPNFFGAQRFGIRENNVDVGIDILKGNFEDAAMKFLTDTNKENNIDAVEARNKLKEELDFKDALSYFPRYLKYERMILDYLSRYNKDYANAFRRLPRQILLMFVHSIESYIFNKELNMRINNKEILPKIGSKVCKSDFFGFPDQSNIYYKKTNIENNEFAVGNIVGYETEELNDYERSIMEELGIEKTEFKIKQMPELNCKGDQRVLFAPYKGFKSAILDDSFILSFSLPSGSYATSLLNEFIQ